MNIQSKINKLCIALKTKGQTYLIDRKQYYNKELSKVCTSIKINRLMPVEEYNKLFPDNKKDENKYDYIKVEVFSSGSNIKVLKKLVELYKEVSEMDE
ncbi:hypothetical protein KYB31_09240 [Clostridium felsineum]|uniref:hypothetical protein n=1 Tax=Clostridium felsineum TaxID=36839 RepID=UPI00214DB0D5|nr:hypothetical protein [Clostridium felsineum]MCR3759173.1 hypothetical protein [Clostridium felsineum]